MKIKKQRSKKAIIKGRYNVSLLPSVKSKGDERAKALDLSFSKYVGNLIKQDTKTLATEAK